MLISIAPPNRGQLFAEIVQRDCAQHCDKLVQSILGFLETYRFDGIEIDWPSAAEHWSDFKLLLRKVAAPLSKKGYTLAVVVRPEDPVDREIASIVDLILLRSWREILQSREILALHPAPLSFVARNVNKWIEHVGTEHTSKIVLGLPIFGQGYTLRFDNFTDVGAPVLGPGRESVYTKQKDGTLAYYEVR